MAYKRVTMGRIEPGELRVGVPLPYTAYDEHFHLLLREGATLTNQRQLDALVARGLYRVDAQSTAQAAPDGPPLAQFDQLCRELNSLVQTAVPDGEFPARLLGIAARLIRICERHSDACLAAILHDSEARYAVRHMVHVAVVSAILGRLAGTSESDRLSTVAAALSMNLSVIDLQNELNSGGERAMSATDRQRILAHPEASVQQLTALGVGDATWLEIVGQHHESFDGSGYPRGLLGPAINRGARIVALADAYTARLRQRPDRDARLPNESLKEVFVGRGASFDPDLVPMLVRAVGIYPPGLLVELENGEVGVVTRLGAQAHAPEVQVVVSAQGNLLPQPVRRRTDQPPQRIRHAFAPGNVRFRIDPLRFWA